MSVTRDTSSFQAAQKSGETIDQYVTVLRKLSETCGFSTLKNSLIKDRIVLGICDTKTTERLPISDLTLEKAIDKVRSAEATEIQQRDMANDPAVHGIGVAKKKPPFRKEPPANEYRPSSSKIFNYRNRERENAQHMARHLTIARNSIISRAYAGHKRTSMD